MAPKSADWVAVFPPRPDNFLIPDKLLDKHTLERIRSLLNAGADPNVAICRYSVDGRYLHRTLPAEPDGDFIEGSYHELFCTGEWSSVKTPFPKLGDVSINTLDAHLVSIYVPLIDAACRRDMHLVRLLAKHGARFHTSTEMIPEKLQLRLRNPFVLATREQTDQSLGELLMLSDPNRSLQGCIGYWTSVCLSHIIAPIKEEAPPMKAHKALLLVNHGVHIHHIQQLHRVVTRISYDLADGRVGAFVNKIWRMSLETPRSLGVSALEASLHLTNRDDVTDICHYVLQHGANVSIYSLGVPPLLEAVYYGHEEVVQMLLDSGADPKTAMDGRIPSLLNVLPPADELQRQRNSAFQEFLLRKWSGLHIAAHRGLSNILSLLIESGADLSYKDEDGASVIEIAIQKHQTLAAITLLAYGHYSQIQLAAISDLVERVYEHPPTDLIEQLFKCYTQLSEVGRELQNQEAVGGCNLAPVSDPSSQEKQQQPQSSRSNICIRCCRVLIESQRLDGSWLSPLPRKTTPSCGLCYLLCDHGDMVVDVSCFPRLSTRFWQNKETQVYEFQTRIGGNECSHSIQLLPVGSHKTLQEIRSLDDTGTGSLAAIAMAKDWLRKCTHNHGLCTFDQTSHYSPTRVLDIGPHQNKGDLKLVQDVTLNEPYVALSHLWGIRGLPVTTIANIEQRLLSIPLEVLSQTIRDAIDVVRCLGYQYLWVDALCIVQDSEVDWLAEASKMSSVYSGAALTIAVADSSDHTQGMFRSRRARCVRPFHLDTLQSGGYRDRMGLIGEGEWYMFPSVSQVQSAVRPKGLLDTRSWVLQEQLLSPRILYFDNGELYWDCITMSASESCPFSASLLVDDNPDETWALKLIRRALAGGNDQDILRERIAEVWVQVIKNYSARKLTKESDKLVALEGISHSLANVLGDTLVGGMWETGLWYQLTWWMDLSPKTSRQQVPDPTFLAPSWSWLSAPRALYYHNSLRDKDFTVGTGSHTFTELRPMLKIVSASSETSIRGTSITGTLVISGLSFDYRLTANDLKTPFWKRWNKTKIFLNPGRWLLDRVVETPSNVRCVVVAEDDVDKLLVCLCLVPDENHHGQWKRVGICHWDGLVWQVAKFAGAEPEPGTFTIV